MSKEELVSKELSNLYAISKQVKQYFLEADITFLSEKWQKILINYKNLNSKNEVRMKEALRKWEINPGNTKDSIVQEIVENLQEINAVSGYRKEIKQTGYLMSLNRLINYHVTNIDNLYYLARLL